MPSWQSHKYFYQLRYQKPLSCVKITPPELLRRAVLQTILPLAKYLLTYQKNLTLAFPVLCSTEILQGMQFFHSDQPLLCTKVFHQVWFATLTFKCKHCVYHHYLSPSISHQHFHRQSIKYLSLYSLFWSFDNGSIHASSLTQGFHTVQSSHKELHQNFRTYCFKAAFVHQINGRPEEVC